MDRSLNLRRDLDPMFCDRNLSLLALRQARRRQLNKTQGHGQIEVTVGAQSKIDRNPTYTAEGGENFPSLPW